MKKSIFNIYIFQFLILLVSTYGMAQQTDPIYINGPYYVAAGQAEQWYGDVTLGPNAQLYIEDDVKILFYGSTFKMEPGAQIYGANKSWTQYTQGSGTGSIVFQQPNPINGYAGQQILDGGNTDNATYNNSNILSSIEIDNPKGVALKNSNSHIGTNILFTSGNLFLDANDMVLTKNATLTNYDKSKFVVTSSTGHLVREDYSGAFEFPVGIAANNYTPAVITPSASNTIHVNVANYATSAPTEIGSIGMDRTWNIFGKIATGATIALQHNTSTNGVDFNSNANYVSQYNTATGKKEWQLNSPSPSKIAGITEINTGTFSSLATNSSDNQAYFTKLSDEVSPQPNPLTISISKTDVLCNIKGSATAIVSGGKEPYLYNWNTGTSTATVSNLAKGTYDVIVSDIDGNIITANVIIDEVSATNPGIISGDYKICSDATTQLVTDGVKGGVWSSSNTIVASVNSITGEVTGLSPGLAMITYTVSNEQGCTSQVSYQIIFEDCKSATKDPIEVFNAISPNGDGKNDELIIKGLENYPNNSLEIFNRWGVKIYATEHYGENGNYFTGISEGRATIKQDSKLPEGVYFYVLRYYDSSGNVKEKVGYLYLSK